MESDVFLDLKSNSGRGDILIVILNKIRYLFNNSKRRCTKFKRFKIRNSTKELISMLALISFSPVG